jgi:hypothetical protein
LPRVTRFFRKKELPPPVVQTAETSTEASAATAALTPVGDTPRFDWKEFLSWMANEPRMTVIAVATDTRDPFSSRKVQGMPESAKDQTLAAAGTADDEQVAGTGEEPVRTPKECGLQLRSTFVGGRKSSANINGTNFRVGDWIAIPSASDDATETDASGIDLAETDVAEFDAADIDATDGFQLVGIEPRFITLQRNGQTFRLAFQKRTGVERKISIRPARP